MTTMKSKAARMDPTITVEEVPLPMMNTYYPTPVDLLDKFPEDHKSNPFISKESVEFARGIKRQQHRLTGYMKTFRASAWLFPVHGLIIANHVLERQL